jgi:dihydroorotate dehydrogenase
MVYKGPGLIGEIKQGLLQKLASEKTSLSQVIGRDATAIAQGRL